MPFIYHQTTRLNGTLLSIMLFTLGNPVLLIFTIFKIFTSQNLKLAFFPREYPNILPIKPKSTKSLQIVSCILGIMYTMVVLNALVKESVGDGWNFIKHDKWSMVAFLDNFLGILFTLTYISIRERSNPRLFLWLGSLLLLGNGVTVKHTFTNGIHLINSVSMCMKRQERTWL